MQFRGKIELNNLLASCIRTCALLRRRSQTDMLFIYKKIVLGKTIGPVAAGPIRPVLAPLCVYMCACVYACACVCAYI